MIAPIMITILFVLYYILYFVLLVAILPGLIVKIAFGIIPVVLMAVMIFVCVERIEEIRSGEEDDISKY